MTLAEVAAMLHRHYEASVAAQYEAAKLENDRDLILFGGRKTAFAEALALLEADSEFTLPERVEALEREWDALAHKTPEEKIRDYQDAVVKAGQPTSIYALPVLGFTLLQPEYVARRLRETLKGEP